MSIYLRTPPSHYCTESETRENRSPPCFFVFSPSSSVFRLRSDLTALIIWRGGGRGSLSSKIIKLNRGVHRDRRRWIVAKVRREVAGERMGKFWKSGGKNAWILFHRLIRRRYDEAPGLVLLSSRGFRGGTRWLQMSSGVKLALYSVPMSRVSRWESSSALEEIF